MEAEAEAGQPHEALFLVLSHLTLSDLLAVSQVCAALRDAVRTDILPWLDLIVQHPPLSRRLSDDTLLKLTSKARGRLRTLSLSNCFKITDDGLLRVVHENPFIEKLYLPGCTGLTPEGIMNTVKILTSNSNLLKCLKIYGIPNLNKDHLLTLQDYLDPSQNCKIRTIDVEICPRCNEVRMVFSCPKETCRECRGCIFCIPRCAECGVCFDSSEETEEAPCGDLLCSECWVRIRPKCSFCNRPYCRQHGNQEIGISGPDRFVCEGCSADVVEDDDAY